MKSVHGIRSVRLLIVLVAMAVGGGRGAQAAVPDAPTDLVAYLANCPNSGYVYLKWSPVSNVGVDGQFGYHIYQASGETSDPSAFEQLAHQDMFGAPGYRETGGYHVVALPVGTFSFYVTAFNSDGESQPSNIVTRTVRKLDIPLGTAVSDSIDFSVNATPAQLQATVGAEITVDLKPRNFSTRQMQFTLLLQPEGMTIDAATGIVRWTPREMGAFPFVVRAAYVDDPDIGTILESEITVAEGTSGVDGGARSVGVHVYPNPARGLLSIALPSARSGLRLSMWNVSGAEVLTTEIDAGADACVVDTKPYPDGIYFVRISDGDRLWTRPVVVAH
jgi:hypothetical protein